MALVRSLRARVVLWVSVALVVLFAATGVVLEIAFRNSMDQARRELLDLVCQAARIETAGVDDDLDAALDATREHVLHLAQKRSRIAGGRRLHAIFGQDHHGELGEIIAGEHVDRAPVDHLAGRAQAVAAHRGEDVGGRRSLAVGTRGFESIDAMVGDLAAALHLGAEQRQERGALEQQEPPRRVVAAGQVGVMQSVARRQSMQSHDSWLPHEQLTGSDHHAIPQRLWSNPVVDLLRGPCRHFLFRSLPQQGHQFPGRFGRRLAFLPVGPDPTGQLRVAASGTVGSQIAGRRIRVPFVIQQRAGQRTQYRLGMLPADALQGAPAVGDEDGFMTDRAEVAGAVAIE